LATSPECKIVRDDYGDRCRQDFWSIGSIASAANFALPSVLLTTQISPGSSWPTWAPTSNGHRVRDGYLVNGLLAPLIVGSRFVK